MGIVRVLSVVSIPLLIAVALSILICSIAFMLIYSLAFLIYYFTKQIINIMLTRLSKRATIISIVFLANFITYKTPVNIRLF